MRTRQTIALIGATGSMGRAVAKSLSKGNYRLLLSARNFTKAKELAIEILRENPNADIETVECQANASWEADIIILAVPFSEEKEIAIKIKDYANQKIVISLSNPTNENYSALLTHAESSAAEELQRNLPNSKVVKAFNTCFSEMFDSPIIDRKRMDAFIAGNENDALDTVTDIVKSAGFNPIVIGDLSVSRTLENMQLLLIRLSIKHQYNGRTGWKILHE